MEELSFSGDVMVTARVRLRVHGLESNKAPTFDEILALLRWQDYEDIAEVELLEYISVDENKLTEDLDD